jgi:plastocyanin
MGRQKWLATAVCVTALLCGGLVQPAGAASAKQVSILNQASCPAGSGIYCFAPIAVSVGSGRTVTWTNKSSTGFHTITPCTPAACTPAGAGTGTDSYGTSGTIGAAGSYSHTFQGAGTYNYYCSIHGYAVMHGTITVTATITTVTPSSIARGSSNVTVHVTGTGFATGIKAKFSGTGVTVKSTTFVDSAHLTLTVTVASTAATGLRTLTVTNTNGSKGKKAGALNVT